MTGVAASDKVVILDRDGTMVIDRGYLHDPAGLEFEPNAAEGLKCLHLAGFRLVVITNQSGVGRGLFNLEQLEAMNARLLTMVESAGARLERIYYCPHAPGAGCVCRKPAQALLMQAAAELGFNAAAATVIGDKESDIEFGRRAGARTILIASHGPTPRLRTTPDLIARDLVEAARAVVSA